MGDTMLAQDREIHGREKFLGAQLHRVHALDRQHGKELVEPGGKRFRRYAASPRDALELEDERARMSLEIAPVGLVDRFEEEIGVQEIAVGLTAT